jgi:hypothetical protein
MWLLCRVPSVSPDDLDEDLAVEQPSVTGPVASRAAIESSAKAVAKGLPATVRQALETLLAELKEK